MAVAERAGHAVRGALLGRGVPGGQPALRADPDPAGPAAWTRTRSRALRHAHSARHSFALYMLVVLNTLTDLRYGLNAEERRDLPPLYGDPWFMVQQLLGHAAGRRPSSGTWRRSPT